MVIPRAHRLRRWPLIAGICFLVALVITALAIDIIGMYHWGWRDQLSEQVARVLVLPAGKVDDRSVRLADFIDDWSALEIALANSREGAGGGSPDAMAIFTRLASTIVIDQQLARYNANLTKADLDQQFDQLTAQFENEAAAAAAINELYRLTPDQFKSKVLRPLMARDRLQRLITQDESLDITQSALNQAEQILAVASATSSNFATMAQQYTQDESGVNTGGDLGWITQGQTDLPESIASVLFASSSVPAVHPAVVRSDIGYHIIKVEERRADPDTGAQSAHARHILIRVDVDDYIRSLLDQAEIVRYIQ